MARIRFDDGWSYRAPLGPFAALEGARAELTPVTLPHDALRDEERRADVPSRGASAYYPQGAYTYLKSFEVPIEWAEKLIFIELQGVYRHAMVFVNEEFAGNRANGYARFVLDLTPYIKAGRPNQLRIEVRSGQDSRWYSGAGLHRTVVLHVTDPVTDSGRRRRDHHAQRGARAGRRRGRDQDRQRRVAHSCRHPHHPDPGPGRRRSRS